MQKCIQGECRNFVFKNCIFGIKNMGIILVNKICKNFTFKRISFVRGKEIKNIKKPIFPRRR